MADPKSPSPTPMRTIAPSTGAKPQGSAAASSPAPAPKAAAKAALKTAVVRKPANFSSLPFWMGLALSVLWIGVVGLIVMQTGAAQTFIGLPLVNWAIGISSIASPVALIWMVTAYLQRAADVQSVTEPLRRQLMMIMGESGAAEVRIRRFNQAIREQLELLRSTQSLNNNDLMSILERVRQHKHELEQFEQHSVYQVREIQEVVRHSMQHLEQLMEDKFTMLRILDGKLMESGDNVARQTDTVREQITALLQEVDSNAQLISVTLERAMHDSKNLAETAQAQEASLVGAAQSASGTLQDLSGKIDRNIAHFLERAGSAREEAERLAGALDAQTRSLDEFSNMMPTRISEAEAILRGVADRLYSSEQMAREQAVQLSEKLSEQTDGLQSFLDRFSTRLNDIDGTLQQRRSDLDGLVARISGATDDLAQQLEGSIASLDSRAEGCLKQYALVQENAQRGTDAIAQQMGDVAARYESAVQKVENLSVENRAQLRAIMDDIGTQLRQLEELQSTAQQVGMDMQGRASTALQNLQHVLERLLAARDAAQTVGETLTYKLRTAVDQNESIISRINEAAQMTVRALGVATETLNRQEGSITSQCQVAEDSLRATMVQLQDQAHAAEQTLRDQNAVLATLLNETQERIDSTDKRIQSFAAHAADPVQKAVAQIEVATAAGVQVLGSYDSSMKDQINRLQQFNARVSGIGEEVSRMTTDTLGSIEQLNSRFLTVRASQEETARSTLEQFSAMADRLQREVGSLGEQSKQAVTVLQQAANDVGQQSQQLQSDAQDSGAKIQIVTSALQNEAMQIRTVLQKQADALNGDLSQAERQFSALGDSLKQRTDAAYALLDRLATHYNELTRSATDAFEDRATKLDHTATAACDRVETLSAAMTQQATQISIGTTQLEGHATQLATTSGKTLQQLSALNEKFSVTQESSLTGAQQVIARLEETNSAFLRQNNSLNDAAQNAVLMIQKAGGAFGEQASKMLDTTHQVEQSVRNLNAATTAFADQTAQVRSTMEQNNSRLLSNLTESLSQLDAAGARLEQTSTAASHGAEQAASRFDEMTQNAATRVGSTSQDLLDIAKKTEGALGTLGTCITQQVASLNIVSEQLGEQQRVLTTTGEQQREQLLDLFEKLGAAHGQASEVADRTITRLTDALQQIHRQLGTLSDQSQTALANVRETGSGFADQAGMMLQHAQQAEQQARTVLSVTSALQDQARQLREALHGESERTGEILGTLLGRLGSGNSELRDLSTTAEIALTSLQNDINNQSAALNGTMQQISDRQRSLTVALDAQRDVLNGLLNRLTVAHDETAIM
ncbi:MAG: hypothetical protein HGA90_01500, partial [Alphaproteobacteria bacterium]|nr:hypothetical protein [Alphaproteobacteria bacterium]